MKEYPADKARARTDEQEKNGELASIRPHVSPDELWDACRVLQDEGWAGGISMGNAIRAIINERNKAQSSYMPEPRDDPRADWMDG